MSDMNRGFYKKYEVTKISNPNKFMNCVVLEFDDPVNWEAIKTFASSMRKAGYVAAANDIELQLEIHKPTGVEK